MEQKIFGIVCEFNPFHNGHAYLIDTAKALGADKIVLAMSGNFVQRGEPALICDRLRAEAALRYGADLVIKIPVAHCLGSADFYAGSAVKLLAAAGCTHLFFGSESGDIEALQKSARLIHTDDYRVQFDRLTAGGLSYARARQQALSAVGGQGEHLASPNNILAVEYLSALRNTGMIPLTVRRLGAGYHDRDIAGSIASATAIRALIETKGPQAAAPYLPAEMIITKEQLTDVSLLDRALLSKLQLADETELTGIPFGQNGFAEYLKKGVGGCADVSQLVEKCTSNRITKARIRRALWCLFLGITEKDVRSSPEFLYVLGASDSGTSLLKSAKLPVVTSLAAVKNTRFAKLESRATDVYGCMQRQMPDTGEEFRKKFIRISH